MAETLLAAAALVFDPAVLFALFAAAVFGIFVGAIPGLTATMATALLVPVTFFLEPVPAIGVIVTATAMAIFAGDLPGALLRIPGTPASAAYADEAFAMTNKGQAERALGTNLVCAALGGLVGAVVLATSAPYLAEFALLFSSPEYFWMACLGLTCAAFLSRGDPVKGVISLLIGLAIATVGYDVTMGFARFTFGSTDLLDGVSFIPAMIGMFAISELLRNAADLRTVKSVAQETFSRVFHGVGAIIWKYRINFGRGSLIGIFVGALPGAGADIAAWISYAVGKRFSKEREKYGTGHVEGLVDASSANNAGLSSAWIPALVFGIPGDTITAIVIGVLFIKGLNPGPTVFVHNPEMIYAVFMIFFLANLVLLPVGLAAIKVARRVLLVPRNILLPLILLFCIVGAYAIDHSLSAVVIITVLGLLGYLMERHGIPIAPAILGIVLGPILEHNMITTLIRNQGELIGFVERPVAAVLGALTLTIWVLALGGAAWRYRRASGPA